MAEIESLMALIKYLDRNRMVYGGNLAKRLWRELRHAIAIILLGWRKLPRDGPLQWGAPDNDSRFFRWGFRLTLLHPFRNAVAFS